MHDNMLIWRFFMLPISRINIKLINQVKACFMIYSNFYIYFKVMWRKKFNIKSHYFCFGTSSFKEKKQKLKIIYIQWNSIRSVICQNSMFCLHRKYTVQSFYVFLGQDLSLCLQPKIFSSYVKNPEIAVNVKS